MNKRVNSFGFGAIELILIIVAFGIIGLTGWYVANSKHNVDKSYENASKSTLSTMSNDNKPKNPTSSKPTSSANVTTKNYTSPGGSYGFTYPSDWVAEPDNTAAENEQVNVHTGPAGSTGDFSLSFRVSTDADSTYQPAAAPHGTVIDLENGLKVWQTTKQYSIFSDYECAKLVSYSGSGGNVHFSYKLSTGKYVTVQGSFCQYQKQVPTSKYEVQIASSEWATAINILDSLKLK